MTELVTRSGAWLMQQAATLPDTVVMKTVAPERGWFDSVTEIASGILTVTVLGLVIALVPLTWLLVRELRSARQLLHKAYADLDPLMRHATSIADNLNYITTSIRGDVEQVNATIASANRRLKQAVAVTEDRLNEFNALLHVVQEEAEGAFVSTAAAVRGVRTGAATFGGLEDAGDDDVEEVKHGDDSESDDGARERVAEGDAEGGGARRAAARPRLRSRRRE